MRNRLTRDATNDQFLKRRRPCLRVHAIAAFIDHRLEQPNRASVEEHLLTCGECMDAVCLALEVQREINADDDNDVVSCDTREQLYGLLHDSEGPDSAVSEARLRLNSRTLARWSFRAAAVLAVCLLGYQVGISSSAAGVSGDRIDQVDMVDPTFGLFDDSTFWIEGELLTAAITNTEVYQQ